MGTHKNIDTYRVWVYINIETSTKYRNIDIYRNIGIEVYRINPQKYRNTDTCIEATIRISKHRYKYVETSIYIYIEHPSTSIETSYTETPISVYIETSIDIHRNIEYRNTDIGIYRIDIIYIYIQNKHGVMSGDNLTSPPLWPSIKTQGIQVNHI